MKTRTIGDVTVGAIGLGAQNLSVAGRPSREVAVATIHAAIDAGVTLIDSSDAYTTEAEGQGHNELLIAEALKSYRGDHSNVLVSTKGGLVFRDDGPWDRVGTPEHLIASARDSRRRLGVESIGLYHLHRPDPKRDFGASVEALRDLLDDGVIRMVGLSNVSVEQIERANRILDGRLRSVENQFSPGARVNLDELEYCGAHGIAYLLWGPLGGSATAREIGGENPPFQRVAAELGVSPQRVALAWELTKGPTVIPIPGAVNPGEIADSAAAGELELSAEQRALLDAA
jgi:aryl-alcohol dehydrogenase-like predicted oxidoreductase